FVHHRLRANARRPLRGVVLHRRLDALPRRGARVPRNGALRRLDRVDPAHRDAGVAVGTPHDPRGAPERVVGTRRQVAAAVRPARRAGAVDLLRSRLRNDTQHLLQRRDAPRPRGSPIPAADGVMLTGNYLLAMLVGYLVTITIETAVLVALLSRRHSLRLKLF